MPNIDYPLPRPDAQTRSYWEGAAAGELRYQRCTDCGCVQRIPRSLCDCCQGTALVWKVSGGIGSVLGFTTVHRAPLPVFKQMVPYVIAIIEMEEGFRVMANALPGLQAAMAIGARVRIGFHDVQGMSLPVIEAVTEAGV